MKKYNRIMAGRRSMHAEICFREGFIGVDYEIALDLADRLPERWQDFNIEFIPIYLKNHPDKSRIAAGLACGFIWTVSKGLKEGDIAITPDGKGCYRAGRISGPYFYAAGQILPHRRPVEWFNDPFERIEMSDELKRSTNSTGTCCDITSYAEELEALIGGNAPANPDAENSSLRDVAAFAMEKHLEDFLVQNWAATELGRDFEIYSEDGEIVGQQYLTDSGPLDILAVSKDKKRLLVVELKKGRASDVVVGQTLRYMGYVKEELAEPGQIVEGAIVALEDDGRIRRALAVTQNIAFYRYEIDFKLVKA
jgi:restriction system protein